MFKSIFIICVVSILFFQCTVEKKREDDKLVAQVFDRSLYESDLKMWLGDDYENFNKKEFVDSWVRKQLLVRKAKLKQTDQTEIDELTANYKESLTIQKSKEVYIERNMSKSISNIELEDTYSKLKDEFQLKRDIFKMELIVTPANHFDKLDLKSFFKKKKFEEFYESLANLTEVSMRDTNIWQSWPTIGQYIPKDLMDEEDLEADKSYTLENDKYIFFIRVFEYIDKNEIAPLSYMKPFLVNAILEKRKEEMLANYSTELYKSALSNNKIKIN